VAALRERVPGLIAVPPAGSKESRVAAVSPLVEAGNVQLPDPRLAPWVADVIEECAAFPNGAHDDTVDALTQALLRFRQRAPRLDILPVALHEPSIWTSARWDDP
jgi:predicted phage terminase large subunit-like protein